MKNSKFLSLAISIIAVSFASEVVAQGEGLHGFETPAPAAFALLGVTPAKIIEPASGQDLVGGLLNGFDENGNFQNGFALEGRPYQWLSGRDFVNDGDALLKNLYKIKLSFATTRGANSQDEALRYGVGLNYTYSWNDFVNVKPSSYNKCVVSRNKLLAFHNLSVHEQDARKQERDDLQKRVAQESQDCYSALQTWASTSASFGVATHKAKVDSGGPAESGAGIWVTGTYSFVLPFLANGRTINGKYFAADNAEISVHGRLTRGELSVIDNVLQDSDREILAARFRAGTAKFRFIGELSSHSERTIAARESFYLWSVGAEQKIFEKVWASVSYGDAVGSSEKSETFSGQVRYAFAESPKYTFADSPAP